MSRVKNIGGSEVHLVVPGFNAVVEPGEIVDVPDFQPAHNPDSEPGDHDYLNIVYDPIHWEPVTDAPATDEAAE